MDKNSLYFLIDSNSMTPFFQPFALGINSLDFSFQKWLIFFIHFHFPSRCETGIGYVIGWETHLLSIMQREKNIQCFHFFFRIIDDNPKMSICLFVCPYVRVFVLFCVLCVFCLFLFCFVFLVGGCDSV